MLKANRIPQNHNNNIFGVITGLFLGSMLGAATMFFMAPQSGKRSRALVQKKGLELLDQTNEKVEDALGQVRIESKRIARKSRHKAAEWMHQGQDLLADQVARAPRLVKSGRKAILGS